MNIDQIRQDTPGTGKMIHFNSAGSSLMPEPVLTALLDYQNEEWREGGYETVVSRREELNSFYSNAAQLLNSSKDEMAYVDSATTAWQRAFFSIPWKNGDEIITANTEYASNYISFLRLKKWFDITIRVARDSDSGEVDTDHIQELINENTRLIAITHMPTMGGVVNPVEHIGSIANENNILYLVDACQSIGQYPLDVTRIGCDFLSGTGRKYLRGPRGTGLLFVKKSILSELDPLSVDLYSGQWLDSEKYRMRKNGLRFETFESNFAAKVGLSRAIEYQNVLGIESTWERVQYIASLFRSKLSNLSNVEVHDQGKVLSGIVTLTVSGKSAAEVQHILSQSKINVSYGQTANSRLYMENKGLEEVVRASVHYYNTEEEVDKVVEKMSGMAS